MIERRGWNSYFKEFRPAQFASGKHGNGNTNASWPIISTVHLMYMLQGRPRQNESNIFWNAHSVDQATSSSYQRLLKMCKFWVGFTAMPEDAAFALHRLTHSVFFIHLSRGFRKKWIVWCNYTTATSRNVGQQRQQNWWQSVQWIYLHTTHVGIDLNMNLVRHKSITQKTNTRYNRDRLCPSD